MILKLIISEQQKGRKKKKEEEDRSRSLTMGMRKSGGGAEGTAWHCERRWSGDLSLVLSLSAFGLCRSLSPTTRTPIIRLFFIFLG